MSDQSDQWRHGDEVLPEEWIAVSVSEILHELGQARKATPAECKLALVSSTAQLRKRYVEYSAQFDGTMRKLGERRFVSLQLDGADVDFDASELGQGLLERIPAELMARVAPPSVPLPAPPPKPDPESPPPPGAHGQGGERIRPDLRSAR